MMNTGVAMICQHQRLRVRIATNLDFYVQSDDMMLSLFCPYFLWKMTSATHVVSLSRVFLRYAQFT